MFQLWEGAFNKSCHASLELSFWACRRRSWDEDLFFNSGLKIRVKNYCPNKKSYLKNEIRVNKKSNGPV